MRVFLLFTVCFLFSVTIWSQKGKAAFSQQVVVIGETFTLTYAHPLPKANSRTEFKANDSFLNTISKGNKSSNDAVEIYKPFRDTIMELEDGAYWIGVYELICWDSGEYVLPPTSLLIDGRPFSLPSLALSCRLLPHQKSIDLYDIRENFVGLPAEKGKLNSFIRSYGWMLLAIILIFLSIYFLKKRRTKSSTVDRIQPLSLEEKTLLAIDELMQKELWKNDKLKEHYIELSILLKSFLGEIYELELKERTSAEIILLLKQKTVDSILLEQLNVVFQQADLVKFAKSDVIEEGVIKTSNLFKDIVKKITQQFHAHD